MANSISIRVTMDTYEHIKVIAAQAGRSIPNYLQWYFLLQNDSSSPPQSVGTTTTPSSPPVATATTMSTEERNRILLDKMKRAGFDMEEPDNEPN